VADVFSKTVAMASFGLAIGHQNVDYELGQLGCFRMLLGGNCLVVSCNPDAVAAWLMEKSGGKEIDLSHVRYFVSMAASDQLMSFITEKPDSMRVAHLTAGDLLYMPAGHVLAMQVRNAEDVLGVRIGVTSAADIPVLKAFGVSAMLKWVLKHLEALSLSPGGVKDSILPPADGKVAPGGAAGISPPESAPKANGEEAEKDATMQEAASAAE